MDHADSTGPFEATGVFQTPSGRVFAAPASPTLAQEQTFLTGLNPDDSVSDNPSYWTFTGETARKWGPSTAGTGATISYYFDPKSHFTAQEEHTFKMGFAMWESVADVHFVEKGKNADFKIVRGDDGGAFANGQVTRGHGDTLGKHTNQGMISIDSSSPSFGLTGSLDVQGGYGMATVIHETGHMLGLGHGGTYNGAATASTDQFSAYDERLYTGMSYISYFDDDPKYADSYPVKGTDWGTAPDGAFRTAPHTVQMLDILAIQQLYGASEDTPMTGGQTYGFHSTIGGLLKQFFDFKINHQPVVTIFSEGKNNTLDVSGFDQDSTIDLNPGHFSSAGGLKNNIAVAFSTVVETAVTGAGDDTIYASGRNSTLKSGAGQDFLSGNVGDDRLMGGAGNDLMFGGDGADLLYGGSARVTTGGGPGLVLGSGAITFNANPGNNSLSTAVNVMKQFSLSNDATIYEATVVPHVTIFGAGGGVGNDYYKVEITKFGELLTLDVDQLGVQGAFDTQIGLYDVNGAVLAISDDSDTVDAGSPQRPGGVDTQDSFLQYTFSTPGTYYFGVFAFNQNVLFSGQHYRIHASLYGEDISEPIRHGDLLSGGAGRDTADYSAATRGVTIDLGVRTEQTGAGGAKGDVILDVETVVGSDFKDALTAAASGSTLEGAGGADRLVGRGKADELAGGAGRDRLTGGDGKDVFVFDAKLGKSNLDVVTDFLVKDDTIDLDHRIFKGIDLGHLDRGELAIGSAAEHKSERIIYDAKSGGLFYDRDGSAHHYDAIRFATLDDGLHLTKADFVIV